MLFSAGQYLRNLFSRSFHCCIFTFLNEPCQLFISKELNHPVTLSCRSPWFYEGKGDGGRLTTTVYDSPTGSTNFQIQIVKYFAFVRSRRDLKEKNYRDGSRQVFNDCIKFSKKQGPQLYGKVKHTVETNDYPRVKNYHSFGWDWRFLCIYLNMWGTYNLGSLNTMSCQCSLDS